MLTAEPSADDEPLLTSEAAFAWRLAKDLGRPLHLISSSEYTAYRALAVIEAAQHKIIESKRQSQAKKKKRLG